MSALDSAAGEFSGSDLEVTVSKQGCEQLSTPNRTFHPEVGEYWKPENITVKGDMTDDENLQLVSDVCDKHGLEVHQKHGFNFSERSEDGWARLVVE